MVLTAADQLSINDINITETLDNAREKARLLDKIGPK